MLRPNFRSSMNTCNDLLHHKNISSKVMCNLEPERPKHLNNASVSRVQIRSSYNQNSLLSLSQPYFTRKRPFIRCNSASNFWFLSSITVVMTGDTVLITITTGLSTVKNNIQRTPTGPYVITEEIYTEYPTAARTELVIPRPWLEVRILVRYVWRIEFIHQDPTSLRKRRIQLSFGGLEKITKISGW